MIAGVVGLIISIAVLATRRRGRASAQVYEERRYTERPSQQGPAAPDDVREYPRGGLTAGLNKAGPIIGRTRTKRRRTACLI
jgi:hypothetical protein